MIEFMLEFLVMWFGQFGGTEASNTLMTATHRTWNSINELKLTNDGNTIVYKSKRKVGTMGKNGREVFYWLTTSHIWVTKHGDGWKLWVNTQGNLRLGNSAELDKLIFWLVHDRAMCDAVLTLHCGNDISGLEADSLCLNDRSRLLIKLFMPVFHSLYGDNANAWVVRLMMSGNINTFWDRIGGKLTKDEKRHILSFFADPEHDANCNLGFLLARISGKVNIKNLRDVEYDEQRPIRLYRAYSAAQVDKMSTGLRSIAPHRRLMMVNGLLAVSSSRARTVVDTLNMLADMRKAKFIGRTQMINASSIDEMHDQVSKLYREMTHTNRPIEQNWVAEYGNVMIDGSDIVVVTPADTETVHGWGDTQHHCIGSYAQDALLGSTILLGFKRGNEWVGHCSIKNKRCTQLLGKYNASLDSRDRDTILDWMKKNDLITTGKADWS